MSGTEPRADSGADTSAARVNAAALNSSLRRLGGRSDDAELVHALQRVIDICGHLFAVDGGGVMLADEFGELRYVAASSEASRTLELAQLEVGEGPCIAAYVQDATVVCTDLANDPTYPLLAARLAPHGIGAVLAVPIELDGFPSGTLNLFVDRPYDFDRSEVEALSLFGAVIESTLQAALTSARAGELAEQLAYALDARIPIERGIGYLMAREQLTHPDAFQLLRGAARASRRPISDIAVELLRTGHLVDERDRHAQDPEGRT